MTSAKASVVELRGCMKCHLVRWVFPDSKSKDCSGCGSETNQIEWTPIPGFAIPEPRVFLLHDSKGGGQP